MRTTTFFRIGSLTAIGLFLAGVLATPALAETKKLDSVALTVGDLGNPFFVQIAHGAEAQAKHINGKVKFTALSSNYDVNNQTNQIDNFISSNVNLILLGAADSKGIGPSRRVSRLWPLTSEPKAAWTRQSPRTTNKPAPKTVHT